MGSENSYAYNHFKNNNNIIFLNTENINFFNVEKINSWFEKKFQDIKINSLATFYDTHFVFEFLKSKLNDKNGAGGNNPDGKGVVIDVTEE